ncbi:class IV adenylate cyclase [Leeuwenhoekiella marinoflava]|uniref:CYTH domain-containing protein n=2 Tax=Leeuwenhoekiella marinoflava TaxID=988 RepID=A0ABY1HMF9_9FLAO|nr:CYTH domain-containing protein [Leeuwenhoekiella marinoflava]RXG32822.1 putative adenylyl cyclase CyaB [Leeuwenhoekiella marinoflava]SHE57963.1 CYTH domain-containing protein [Leeuwenhoekiella marinoflava DSM 3653]
MYEVELTARLKNHDQTRKAILKLSLDSQYRLDYDDRYFDKDNTLTEEDQEFRLRTKTNLDSGEAKHYLTFKDKPFEKVTRSKPEYESIVLDHHNTEQILLHLGYIKTAHYTKHCEIFNLNYNEASVEIALVQFDELEDSFIEIETSTANHSETDALFEKLYRLLAELELSKDDLTEDFYIEMIKEAQSAKK